MKMYGQSCEKSKNMRWIQHIQRLDVSQIMKQVFAFKPRLKNHVGDRRRGSCSEQVSRLLHEDEEKEDDGGDAVEGIHRCLLATGLQGFSLNYFLHRIYTELL